MLGDTWQRKARLVDAQPKAGRLHRAIPAGVPTNLWLVLYALAAGILIVSAGVLVAAVERLWSPSGGAITLLVTAIATIIAGVSADAVLEWLRASSVGRQVRS
jgi:hypothetical protein